MGILLQKSYGRFGFTRRDPRWGRAEAGVLPAQLPHSCNTNVLFSAPQQNTEKRMLINLGFVLFVS
jgi:hypothetical protein